MTDDSGFGISSFTSDVLTKVLKSLAQYIFLVEYNDKIWFWEKP